MPIHCCYYPRYERRALCVRAVHGVERQGVHGEEENHAVRRPFVPFVHADGPRDKRHVVGHGQE